MKQIKLTKGQVALVDDEDYTELIKHKWCAAFQQGKFRATRKNLQADGTRTLYMSREIKKAKKGEEVGYVDGDTLNNQKANLEFRTRQEINWRRCPNEDGTSKFKGVSWNKHRGKWRAQIKTNGKMKALGRFDDELKAHEAYEIAAKELHGKFYRELK